MHGQVWAHRGRGYGMKAAWKKWGQSTEMGVVSTKWRGLEHAGGPERVEGERDVAPHMRVHRAEWVVQQDLVRLRVRCASKRHVCLCRIQCRVPCPYRTKPRRAPSARRYTPLHVSSAQFITHRTSAHLRLMPFSPLSMWSPCGSISRSCISAHAHTTTQNHALLSARPNSPFSHSGAQMRCGGGMRRGRRVSEVWERAGMTWGVVWGRAREYGAWDALTVGLGASLGA